MEIKLMGGNGAQAITRAESDRVVELTNKIRRSKRLLRVLAESMMRRRENGAEVDGPNEVELDYYVIRGERVRALSVNGVEIHRLVERPESRPRLREAG